MTRAQDALAAERRQLPMVKVDKGYVFDTPSGRKSLAELFDGKSQLMIYHFMMGPDWVEGCASCSFLADHLDGATIHLEHRDVKLMAVSRAPLANIEAFRRRMGGSSPGRRRYATTSITTTECRSRKRGSPAGRPSTTTCRCSSRWKKRRPERLPEDVVAARSFTPTRPTAAAAKRCWARTTSSTSRRRDAAKTAWRLRCHGCGTTIATTLTTRSTRTGSIPSRRKSRDAARSMSAGRCQ